MKSWTKYFLSIGSAILLAGVVSTTLAGPKANPYLTIVAHNPFRLSPPTPATPPPKDEPILPPAKVVLTGITTLLGPPQALLEITEMEAGKMGSPRRPILRAGERDGPVEVLAIDVQKSLVRIRMGRMETNVTFETAKLSPSAPAPAMAPAVAAAAFPNLPPMPRNPRGTRGMSSL